ncbi:MAG: arginine--tRNA ligase [Planctomycetota bacterium]|nr:arginine--tRNA ligase [Planctomycetota bacterium]
MASGGAHIHHVLHTLARRVSACTGLPDEKILGMLRPPPKAEMGDYAFPCFELAKEKKKAPPVLAKELAEVLIRDVELAQVVHRVEAEGPFLNFHAQRGVLCSAVLRKVCDPTAPYAQSGEGAGKTIVIDYSAPNIAKPFHVGHLMSTVLGASLVRIHRLLGYKVEGVNHLGDWGTQCGYQFLAWQRADPKVREEQLAARGLEYLVELYVGINQPAKTIKGLEEELLDKNIAVQPDMRAKLEAQIAERKPAADEIDREARALFKKLEDGDAELRALWLRMRETTLAVLQKSYDRLGVSFESSAGEGFYEEYMKKMVKELKDGGKLTFSEGAWVIPLSEEGAKKKRPPFIIIKSDGGTKYDTRDLAAAIYRKETYGFYKNLYVVSVPQSAHFEGLFLALEKLGHAWAKDCVHVSFGIMQIKEGDETLPMSTRSGRMIPLNELLDTMVEIVRKIVEEKNPELPAAQKAVVAEAVGVGAIVFWIQSRRRTSNIVFDWKGATSPEGDTGPYVQYTHARACSILRKFGAKVPLQADLTLLVENEELAVCKQLERFPAVVQDAAAGYEPSLIATWLLETSRAFNDFYNKHQVLKAEHLNLMQARLVLVDATRAMLAKGLGLLGISAPEEM